MLPSLHGKRVLPFVCLIFTFQTLEGVSGQVGEAGRWSKVGQDSQVYLIWL